MPPSKHFLRTGDLEREGLSRVAIRRMAARGELLEVSRGLYARPSLKPGVHHSLAVVGARAPRAVICLLSALAFHGLTTQAPNDVWIALPPRTWAPVIAWPKTHVVRFSGARLVEGIERHRLEGVNVSIYGVAKTVVDCFRYRQKLGLEVALEALREGLHARRVTKAELWELAGRQRAGAAFRTYLEAVE